MTDTKGKDPCPNCDAPLIFENEAPALRPRTRLHDEQYLVGKRLGRGGFGITYLALDTGLQMRVAIKEFFPKQIAGRGTNQTQVVPNTKEYVDHYEYGLSKFLEEAQMLAHFNHRTIVPVLFFFRENNSAYFVMRYIEGKTLESHIKELQGKISEQELLKIMLRVLEGLQVLHEKSTFHRDIKPQNIYLANDGYPLLLDFGSARQAMQDENQTLSVFFTPGYAPIEQYPSGKHPGTGNIRQGAWTDIYACAATLYSCFRGSFRNGLLEPPLEPTDRLINTNALPPIHTVSKTKLSAPVANAIMAGLELYSEHRPQSVSEFQRLLTQPPPLEVQGPRQLHPSSHDFELFVLAGEFEGERIPLSSKPVIMGKNPAKCALVFSDDAISRTHCQIHVEDLNSSNGTWINDERQQTARLQAGDMISLAGRVAFQIVAHKQSPKRTLPFQKQLHQFHFSANYQSFLKKTGAFFIDAAGIILTTLLVFAFFSKVSPQAGNPLVFSLLLTLIAWGYWTYMESSRKQASFGKLVYGMIVADTAGKRISFEKAAKRNMIKLAPLVLFDAVLFIGNPGKHTALTGSLIVFLFTALMETIQAGCDKFAGCFIMNRPNE